MPCHPIADHLLGTGTGLMRVPYIACWQGRSAQLHVDVKKFETSGETRQQLGHREVAMPGEKIDEKHPAHADSELRQIQQRLVDDTFDNSFPASDPPAWTTGAKSVAAERGADDAPVQQDNPGGRETGQGWGALSYVQQAGQAVARPVQNHPVAALLAAGAVGYGLAWLIHRNTERRATSSRSGGGSDQVGRRGPLSSAHPEAEDFEQPWPSGDSPKPHGDKLPNLVKIAPDNRDRY